MASHLVASGSTPDDFEDQEDLSNEQMRALLLKAEEQMRAAVTVETPSDDTIHLWNAPYAEDPQILPRYLHHHGFTYTLLIISQGYHD